VFVPFLVLAVTMIIGKLLGPPDANPQRRAIGAGLAGGLVLLIVLQFFYFYPILSATPITYNQWHARMWFSSWI
jgi:dolichyl-phosphate-mannose--protein O-mannosyl transferase